MSQVLDYNDLVFLVDRLGRTTTMALSGAHSQGEVEAWLGGRVAPNDAQIERLNFACDLFKELSASQDSDRTRDWFLGIYAKEHEASPVEAIREGYFDAVRAEADRIMKDSPLEEP